MKKSLIAITLMLTLGMNTPALAQKHRHTPRTEQVDTVQKNRDAIEAYSDTTAIDSIADSVNGNSQRISMSDDQIVRTAIDEVMDNIDGEKIGFVFMVLGILFILFVLFPIIVIIGVVYLINRNRKEKYKLAQMAIQNGQPIPDQLLKEEQDDWDKNDYQSGMRQLFLGLGLMAFLGYTAGEVGFGIGVLVFCIGLGKVVIAKSSQKKNEEQKHFDHHETNNNSNNPSEL